MWNNAGAPGLDSPTIVVAPAVHVPSKDRGQAEEEGDGDEEEKGEEDGGTLLVDDEAAADLAGSTVYFTMFAVFRVPGLERPSVQVRTCCYRW